VTTTIGTARVADCVVQEVTVGTVPYLAARFDIDVVTQGAVRLGDLMDAIALRVPRGATGRVYAWPVETISPPCAVVAYPNDPIDFDLTYGRGSDRLRIPLYFMVGKAVERTARDALSGVLTGATGIKDALDGALTIEEA
jgi:hypothetical protein